MFWVVGYPLKPSFLIVLSRIINIKITIMTNLKELTLADLQSLLQNVTTEISSREATGNGFDAEYNISANSKAYKAATYKQIEFAAMLAKKTNSIISPSTSQLMKRMEMDEIGEAIDLMKEGKRVHIY